MSEQVAVADGPKTDAGRGASPTALWYERDEGGRYRPGNKGGPGNPFARQVAMLRRELVECVTREEVREIARKLLELAKATKLPEELKAAAGAALHQAQPKEVKQLAAKLFPLPAAKDNTPLPAIGDLVQRKGDAEKGKAAFANAGTCANCHVVNGAGKEVGPDLSEIGKKLSKEALYESILFPSAGISHNYEMYVLATKTGTTMQGVMVSQTPEEVTLKGADAVPRTFKRKDIEVLEKSLGKKAQIEMLPMQPGDVPATMADVSALEADTGYRPKTTVEEGVPRFVEWYRRYYKV